MKNIYEKLTRNDFEFPEINVPKKSLILGECSDPELQIGRSHYYNAVNERTKIHSDSTADSELTAYYDQPRIFTFYTERDIDNYTVEMVDNTKFSFFMKGGYISLVAHQGRLRYISKSEIQLILFEMENAVNFYQTAAGNIGEVPEEKVLSICNEYLESRVVSPFYSRLKGESLVCFCSDIGVAERDLFKSYSVVYLEEASKLTHGINRFNNAFYLSEEPTPINFDTLLIGDLGRHGRDELEMASHALELLDEGVKEGIYITRLGFENASFLEAFLDEFKTRGYDLSSKCFNSQNLGGILDQNFLVLYFKLVS